jgi:fucose permease
MVAEVNPGRRGATLNLLNFCWSAGAVSCPFLVAIATRKHQIPILLGLVAACLLLVLVGIAFLPSSVVEPTVSRDASGKKSLGINWRHHSLPALATLFFVYVGVENGFGGWVATYSKSLGRMTPTMSLMTPSFFYAALTLGRWLAPLFLRWMNDARLVQAGLLIACVGMSGLMLSHALPGVIASACLAGLGLSSVYPITISFLSREFGPAASRIGSVMFMLSNLGGGLFPWIVGVLSSHFGTLKAGLAVPLIGSAAMYILYLRDWQPESTETA